MKEIKAYIRVDVLSSVATALGKLTGVSGMSAVRVYGFGRTGPKESKHELILRARDFPDKFKIEIACADNQVGEIVATIERAARTGRRGDGKIYVSDIQQAVRIETGERGEIAV